MSGKYTEFELQPNGNLRITLLEEERASVEDIASQELAADNKLAQVIEWQLGNGWEFVRPEDIASLTDAPILTEEIETDNQGNVLRVGTVYWYSQYETSDPVAKLLENGYVDFERGN